MIGTDRFLVFIELIVRCGRQTLNKHNMTLDKHKYVTEETVSAERSVRLHPFIFRSALLAHLIVDVVIRNLCDHLDVIWLNS